MNKLTLSLALAGMLAASGQPALADPAAVAAAGVAGLVLGSALSRPPPPPAQVEYVAEPRGRAVEYVAEPRGQVVEYVAAPRVEYVPAPRYYYYRPAPRWVGPLVYGPGPGPGGPGPRGRR